MVEAQAKLGIFRSKVPPTRREIWDRFVNDPSVLSRYRVSQEEIEALRTAVLLGNLKSVNDIIFILKQIRAERTRY